MIDVERQAVKIGCCGFPIAQKQYHSKFEVIEVQTIFYNLPKPEQMQKWRDQAPSGFEFTVKASQFITHPATCPTYRRTRDLGSMKRTHLGNFQPSREVFDVYAKMVEFARILRAGVMIFQSPPSFQPTEKNLSNIRRFFEKVDRKGLVFGWESRGEWPADQVKTICSDLGLIDVVDPFLRETTTTGMFYYRLHGGKDYSKQFTTAELAALVGKIRKKRGYVMFNNASMVADAKNLESILLATGQD